MADARLRLELSSDFLTASVTVAEGEVAGSVALEECLRRAGVVFGVQREVFDALAKALADPAFRSPRVILAQGYAPEHGQDGAFLPAFEYGIQPGHLRDDGTMDFMDRELLKPVRQGEALGELRAARQGKPGRGVDGRELPARAGKESKLELGEGVVLKPDGVLCAARAGVVQYIPGKRLDVVQKHEHRGDVDMRSGHLAMEGSLIVQRSVLRPFHVTASGDVEIRGGVEGGSVYAGGSIWVRGGVVGGDDSVLSAVGDITLRHAERAHVTCGGLLQLESAVNCELTGERIQARAQLRGGHARAERSIELAQAGSANGGDITLAVGVVCERPLDEVRRALEAAKAQRALRNRAFGSGRAPLERGKAGKRERAAVGLAHDAFEHKLQVAARREILMREAHVDVHGMAHAGVTVRIGEAQLLLEQEMSNVRFCFDHGLRCVRWERLVQ